MTLSAPAPPAPPPPPRPRRRVVMGVLAVVIVTMLGVLAAVIVGHYAGTGPSTPAPGPPLYVKPSGRDGNDGASAATPLATIQAALQKAGPGTVINLAAGVYHEQPTTV